MTAQTNTVRSRPLGNRTVSVDYLFEDLNNEQFETVLSNLRLGNLNSKAFILDIGDRKTFRYGNKMHSLRKEDWLYFALRTPESHKNTAHVYLIDYEADRLHTGISLVSSEVNRVLGLTGQSGGQPPKMSARLYAFLAVQYARTSFETDPQVLLAVLEERHDLWGDAGVIDGRRGLDAVKEFLRSVEEFESEFDAKA